MPGRNVSFWWQMNCQRQRLLSCLGGSLSRCCRADGAANSHAAIMVRALGIPTVMGADIQPSVLHL